MTDSMINIGSASSPAGTAKPRERVLQAALELFVEQGYFNTNVPDISRRSKCSVGSIYHHFLNKEEIAAEIYRHGIGKFREALGLSLDAKKSLESNVVSIVRNFLFFAEQERLLAQYLWLSRHQEFLNSDKNRVHRPTRVGFDKLSRELTLILKSAMRNNEMAKVQADVIWTILFGIPLGYIQDWLDGYTKSKPSEVADKLAKSCVAALKAAGT